MRPSDPRVRRQLAPAGRPLAVVVAAGIGGSLLLILQAYAVTELILAVLGDHSVWPSALAVVGVFAARGLVGWVGDVAAARAAAVVGTDLRRRVVGAILRRHGTGSSGALSVLATRGVAAAEPYLTRYVPALVLAGILPFVVLVVIAILDPMSGLIVVLTLPLIPVFGILVGLATRDRAQSQWRAMSILSGHFLDVVRGLPTLVAFRRAERQSETIRAVTDRYRVRALATLRIAFASSAILELVATISVALVAVTVGIRLADGDLGLRTALMVLLLAPEAYWPLRRVGTEFHAAAEGAATLEAAADLERDRLDETGVRTPSLSRCSIQLSDLAVTYPDRTWPALGPVSLEIPAEGVTAVTGPSGCGKSTLLAVLAGLVEPTTGWVRRPGQEQIAWVPQRPVFVAGSVADNLRLAAPDAADAQLWDALAEVALAQRVADLPDGLHTDLAEDGLSLSAGERARLALARAVLADRPWVLIDEPSAHLDPVTERVIADTVRTLGRARGVVLVAHKTALVEIADRVIALQTLETPDEAVKTMVRSPAPSRQLAPAHLPADGKKGPVTLWGAALLGGFATASGVALTATAGWLIVRASYQPVMLTLLAAIVAVRAFGLARPALRYVERLWSHDLAMRLLADKRVEVYDALVPLVPGGLGTRRRGDLLASIVDDVDCVLDEELRVRLPVRGFAIAAAVSTAVAALIAPVAAAVVAVCCVVGGGVALLLARRGAAAAARALVTTRAEISDRVVEAAQAATELVMWQAEERVLGGVDRASTHAGRATTAATRSLGAARAVVLLTAGVGVAGMALLLRAEVAAGDLSGPLLALLVLLPVALAESATGLADAGAVRARTVAASRRLAEMSGRPRPVVDPPDPLPAPADAGVDVAGVSAAWDGHEALSGLDVTIAEGDRVAVVGPSGSGKSTLAALMLRFLDPTGGRMSLGGRRLDELSLADVRGRVGLVDDDPHLFASTLVENIRLARPEASDAEVVDALRRAHLGGWLDGLPDGLHTRLGDGAAGVSGGERARIAVARSLLADQPVLVLDEPVAHLDTTTAHQLAHEVLGGPDRRTVLWITHAAAGLDLVDRMVVLGSKGAE